MNIQIMIKYVKRAMDSWKKEAKRICPKRTHAMKTSIDYTQPEISGSEISSYIGTMGIKLRKTSFHYPLLVHNGRSAPKMVQVKTHNRKMKTAKGTQSVIVFEHGRRLKPVQARPFFDWSYKNIEKSIDRHLSDGMKAMANYEINKAWNK